MRFMMLAVAATLALLNVPAVLAAQDETVDESAMDVAAPADPMAGMSEMFAGLFTKEPLTPEQEARLPAAQQLVAKIIPEGTMGEMMDKIMGGALGSMLTGTTNVATTALARHIGSEAFGSDLTEEEAGELASLFDPAWKERQEAEAGLFPAMMKDVMALIEPSMRKAMSELYAIRFTSGELAQIDAFFSTGTGAKYARESFLMASDPRIMASSMEAMPALMGSIGDMEKRMAESVADLPAVRSFADLSPEERAKVAEMTGLTVEEIEANLDGSRFEVEEAYSTDEEVAAADAAADAQE